MASPCEVLVSEQDRALAERIVEPRCCRSRAHRSQAAAAIGPATSIDTINTAGGRTVVVDEETARLLDYAAQLFELSEGKFDVTSGVLRRAWRFDGSDRVPSAEVIAALLPLVGWQKVRWHAPKLTLEPGMEIDLGGIGKEYAVDRAAALVRPLSERCLLNFGGDLLALGPQAGGWPWRVGVESLKASGNRGEGDRAPRRCARDEWRHAPFPAQGRQALQPHSRSDHRMAGRRRAAVDHRCRTDVHASGNAGDAIAVARPRCGGVSRGPARAALGTPLDVSLSSRSSSARRSCRSRRETDRTPSWCRSGPRSRGRAARGETPRRRGRVRRRC